MIHLCESIDRRLWSADGKYAGRRPTHRSEPVPESLEPAATSGLYRKPLNKAADQPIDAYFGQGYYEVYRHFLLPVEQTESETRFLLDVLDPKPGERWLDLPCGYGRHLLELKRLQPDLHLFGGDLNAYYLHEPGLQDCARVACLDMRSLPFAAESFDVVLNLLNSFGYFPGNRRDSRDEAVIEQWARVLRPGGRLVIDVANRRALVNLVRREPLIRYRGGSYEVVEEFRWDPITETLSNRTLWRWEGGHEEGGYRLRLYTPTQLTHMLSRLGFSVGDVFGDFDGSEFDSYSSERMLLVARRTPY